ncbi:DUF3732 domain-containing protein [Agrobacterium tumefaciens]|uniref:DUF3732 domain-containing protein n=1 Tax=Agrobacterium tumefaciens TaxID=358 RepID=A0AA44F752_AGRTU|nr:DUF3732 domain-containing protein [Agrobacterium tumefaciens]NTB87512.1 DUF3732 domain-containing protein [Agrobacterium tumefaciens]NTC17497.1 DUF3732 domain-containing protein [Agrobacterium tumefaciens]NTC29721.1 DUF3732 domain-containing protein [Agrobacterium tumefaciens]
MYFQIIKLILWPRRGGEPRVVDFKPGIVNVISGASKTGKSAVVPIIDYCLGSDKCTIPVGVIRENCSWFGVLVDTIEGQKLLARREPGDQQSTGDMVFLEEAVVDVPAEIAEKTTNVDTVKRALNRLSGLTDLEFEPNAEGGYKSRPSFRDLMAFSFQPQNIVANPDVMFFKADTTEHREKLKTIFPYVLGAVTATVLQARFELDRLQRTLRRKETELKTIESANNAWKAEALGWLRQAIELGILPADTQLPKEWPDIVDLLRRIAMSNGRSARPNLPGIDVTLARLGDLRTEETEIAGQLSEHRQRLNELRRLVESSEAYGDAMRIQRDRIGLADWLRGLSADVADPIVSLGEGGREKVLALCDNLDGLEIRLRTHPTLSNTLDKEIFRLRAAAETTLEQLNAIRAEISDLEKDSERTQAEASRFDQIERFLGRLQQALHLYDRADQSSDLRQEIDGLRTQISLLQQTVSEADIRRKLGNALDRVANFANRMVPRLDAEWPDAPLRLIIEDLTVKVLRGTREDYLWEIGSGANWLAYHVALMLALQRFFLGEPHHAVPSMLVFDQPSQVYFPKRAAEESVELVPWRDQDVAAVRKVFSLLGSEAVNSQGRLQVIVLDHADEDVWGDIDGVNLIEEWRDGRALVPTDWL